MTTLKIEDLKTDITLDKKSLAEVAGGWFDYMSIVRRLDAQYAHNLATTHSPYAVASMWLRGARGLRGGGYTGVINPGIYGRRQSSWGF